MVKYFLAIILLFIAFPVLCQTHKVIGIVHDMENNKWVENAIISINDQNIHTYTDSSGQFTVYPKTNKLILKIYHLNYKTKEIPLTVLSDTLLFIPISPISQKLNEVIVSQFSINKSSDVKLTSESIQKNAMVSGEANIYELLQKSTGIIHSSEVTPGLFVRGLSDGNTSTYFNNINLLGIYHVLSIFPTFNSNTIKNATFYKNNTDLEWHGSLSSYLVVTSENEIQNNFSSGIEIGLLTSKVFLTLPLLKNKLSLTTNIRRTYFDLIVDLYNKKSAQDNSNNALPDYGFWDGDISIQADMGKSGKFLFSLFSSRDNFIMETDQFNFKSRLNNQLGSIIWKNNLSENLTLESSIGFSNYTTLVLFKNIDSRFLQNKNALIQGKLKVSYKYNQFNLEVGISQDQLKLNFSAETDDAFINNKLANSLLFSEYIEGEYSVLRYLKFKGGIRFEHFRSEYKINGIAPSFSTNFKFNNNILELSWSKHNQYQHMYTPLGINLPMKIWYPSDKTYPPEQASQIAFEYNRRFVKNLNFNLGLYYISLVNQVEFLEGNSILSENYHVDVGKGYSKGIELSLKYSTKNILTEVGYTRSESKRQFMQINDGEWFNPPYDVPHKVDLLINLNLRRNWNFNLSQFYQSGMIITLPTGIYFHQDADNFKYDETNITPIYGKRYNFRMPPNHRMDIAFQKTVKHTRLTNIFSFGIYNVYGYQNPYFIYFRPKLNVESKKFFLEPRKKSLLPLIPFFNIKFIWK